MASDPSPLRFMVQGTMTPLSEIVDRGALREIIVRQSAKIHKLEEQKIELELEISKLTAASNMDDESYNEW